MVRVSGDATKVLAVAAIGLTLCGCTAFRQALGTAKNPPDEFTVLTKAPLVIPPDFNLRPPQPGAAARNEPDPDVQAREALFPQNAQAQAALLGAGFSEGERFLLTRTNALAVDSNIRRRVTADAGQEDLGADFAQRLLSQPAGTAAVTPAAPEAPAPVEVQAAVTPAAPPAPVEVQATAPPAPAPVEVQAAAPSAAPPAPAPVVIAAAPPVPPELAAAPPVPQQPAAAPAPAAPPDLAQPLPDAVPQPAGELTLAGSATPQDSAVFDAPGMPGVRMMAPIPDSAPPPQPAAAPPTVVASVAAPPAVAALAPAPAGGGFVLQIGAYRTEQSATSGLRALNARSQTLSQLEQGIQVVDLGADGTVYRVQAGRFADRPSAASACEALKLEGVECFVADLTSSDSPASGQASLSPGG
jgi:hypothetical protein